MANKSRTTSKKRKVKQGNGPVSLSKSSPVKGGVDNMDQNESAYRSSRTDSQSSGRHMNNDYSYKEYKSLVVEYGKNSKFPELK